MNTWQRFLLAPLVGAVGVGGFHPFEYWISPIVSLGTIIFLAEGMLFSHRIWLFYLFGVGFLAPLLHWSSTYVGAVPWIALFLGFGFFYSILALGFAGSRVQPLAFAGALTVAEGLRAIVPFGGFGWGRVGFSQLGGPFQEWLRLGGVALTGFVVALTVALLMRRNRFSLFAIPLLGFGLVATLPANAAEGARFEQDTRIALIQGGVSQLGLSFNATPQEVFDRHFQVTESVLRKQQVDLVLWPENASDIDPLTNDALRSKLRGTARDFNTPLVIGAVTQGDQGPENVSLLFDGGDDVVSRYQKRDLVPFGEYIPFRSITSRISPLAETVRDFVPGSEITTHSVNGLKFAPLICYEILDDRVTYDNLELSTIGVVQTNNATFGRSWQSGQQFQMTRVRAYENRIPFVVAATTGDTALIGAEGEVKQRLTKFESGALVVAVTPSEARIPALSPELALVLAFGLLTVMTSFNRIRE